MATTGRIHSFQSLGTLDGPGVRFVTFMQGCNLRCGCCHNPDTWDCTGGTEYTADEVLSKAVRYKEYFKDNGGITLSGGEPLLQTEFAKELFSLCKGQGIHTCLDTSGSILNKAVTELLCVTDRVLLDIKYTDDVLYKDNVGCSYRQVLSFLETLNELNIPTTLRQVIIPTINDNAENVAALKRLKATYPCVDGIELLPFKKICQVKYDQMGLTFPFGHLLEPTKETMSTLQKLLDE